MPVHVERLAVRIEPDPRRMLSRFFAAEETKMRRRVARIMGLPEEFVEELVSRLVGRYASKHHEMASVWLEHFQRVEHLLPKDCSSPSIARQHLIGAYFTMDYALEAVALFNPSIVEHLDQADLEPGSTRFLLTLRAVGEGHLSSIVARTGIIDSHNGITLDEPAMTRRALVEDVNPVVDKDLIRRTLRDLAALGPLEELLLERLGEKTSPAAIRAELETLREKASPAQWQRARDNILSLVESNHALHIPEDAELSELVIFPVSENESRGVEDLRLVKFAEDDGTIRLLGTYSAFNGHTVFPTLLVLDANMQVHTHSMSGHHARNKGMAIFPRRIKGRFVMSGRLDGENLYILESDSPLVWNEGRKSMQPKYWWQFSAIGNCGSPVETKDGWLMLIHGVGPMRQYCIGAVLLDLDDPTRIIGELNEPLIEPEEDESVGYVPNVVYTCGSMVHSGSLIIPYAVSDVITKFARVDLEELLRALRSH